MHVRPAAAVRMRRCGDGTPAGVRLAVPLSRAGRGDRRPAAPPGRRSAARRDRDRPLGGRCRLGARPRPPRCSWRTAWTTCSRWVDPTAAARRDRRPPTALPTRSTPGSKQLRRELEVIGAPARRARGPEPHRPAVRNELNASLQNARLRGPREARARRAQEPRDDSFDFIFRAPERCRNALPVVRLRLRTVASPLLGRVNIPDIDPPCVLALLASQPPRTSRN